MNKQLFGSSRGSAMKAVAIAGRTCAVLLVGLLVSGRALAQQSCIRGMHIDGVITDPTGAVIPGAKVQAGNGATGVTDATGHYVFACVPLTSTTITADADGFAQATARAHAHAGGAAHVNLRLAVAPVQTDVEVHGNVSEAGDHSASTATDAFTPTLRACYSMECWALSAKEVKGCKRMWRPGTWRLIHRNLWLPPQSAIDSEVIL